VRREHPAVDPAQGAVDGRQCRFDRAPQVEKRLLAELRREHVPRPVDEVVRLIDQERVVAWGFAEEAAQVGPWVECVIVVAHDQVGPGRQVERQLAGAHGEPAGHLGGRLACPRL